MRQLKSGLANTNYQIVTQLFQGVIAVHNNTEKNADVYGRA